MRDFFINMISRIAFYTGIAACIGIIIACFMPWTHYNSINETFTGFRVTKFPSGTTYGKAGYIISTLAVIILILFIIPQNWAKKVNLFFAGFLVAYSIRTYIIFTSSLFKGEVETYAGMYLVL